MPRAQFGEENGRSLLTDSDRDMIRDLYEEDRRYPLSQRLWTQVNLASKFDVDVRTIRRVLKG